MTVHRAALLHALERHGIGEPPEILTGADAWLPPENRALLHAAADEDLAAQEVLTSDGKLTDEFRDALNMLVRPAVEYFCWVHSDELGHYAIQVAGAGEDCVLLQRRGDWLRLLPADPDTMVDDLLDQLPGFVAGSGDTITLPESDAPWADGGGLTDEARRLRWVLELPRYGGGQVHAATRSRAGTRTRSAAPLTYLDTEDGRWLLAFDLTGHERWIVATPATPQSFPQKISELLP